MDDVWNNKTTRYKISFLIMWLNASFEITAIKYFNINETKFNLIKILNKNLRTFCKLANENLLHEKKDENLR